MVFSSDDPFSLDFGAFSSVSRLPEFLFNYFGEALRSWTLFYSCFSVARLAFFLSGLELSPTFFS
jgi:hypothetical protein